MSTLINANPTVFAPTALVRCDGPNDYDDDVRDPIDPLEVFDIIRDIIDPEHPLTLEQLKVANLCDITVNDAMGTVSVAFTPTVAHCSMSTLIGLSIKVKLMRSLPKRFKIKVMIKEGTHSSEDAVNKQLDDKERCAAALENPSLVGVINQCIG